MLRLPAATGSVGGSDATYSQRRQEGSSAGNCCVGMVSRFALDKVDGSGVGVVVVLMWAVALVAWPPSELAGRYAPLEGAARRTVYGEGW